MYLRTTYDQEFDDLYMHLKAKYPAKLFDLEGIGKQLDMSAFSKNFFASKVTSDASIDANANVDDISVIAYTTELPKPFLKMNSYYVLWKELKKLYGLSAANQIVEMQLTGDIYIHDFHGVGAGMPYSYYGGTVLALKVNGVLEYTAIEDFYNRFCKGYYSKFYPTEYIDSSARQINLSDIQILDDNGNWTNVSRILRHRSHTGLLRITTENGKCTIVTLDHPVMLADGEKKANKIEIGDVLRDSDAVLPLEPGNHTSNTYAYTMGYFMGGGYVEARKRTAPKKDKCDCDEYQGIAHLKTTNENVPDSKIAKMLKRHFGYVEIDENSPEISFGFATYIGQAAEFVLTNSNAVNRKLTSDILRWSRDSIKELIAGAVDSAGAMQSNGDCEIKSASFMLVQQLREIIEAANAGYACISLDGKMHIDGIEQDETDIYKLTCRFTDRGMAEYSEKLKAFGDEAFIHDYPANPSEGNRVCRIEVLDAPEYVYDITTDSGHFHCQGLLQHNCFNYSTYDILVNGLPMVKKIASVPPRHLYAFKSQLEQFTIVASNSTLGATGLADMLIVMSYFVKNILKTKSDAHFHFAAEEDCWSYVRESITSFVYTINQPMRANQSPFTNVSIYDDIFLNKLKEDYVFPDGTTPDLDIVRKLQAIYLDVMNTELKRTPLTFPVTTACFSVNEDKEIQDEKFLSFIAKANQEFGFINIYCGDSSTLSSCCRLRSERDNEYFNSFGSGSSKIGSLGVCSINFPRLAIKYPKKEDFLKELQKMVEVSARVNNAKRHIVKKRIDNGNEPLYSLGFMDISKQYSTTGVNGFNECIELLGSDILTEEGQQLALEILDTINAANARFQKQYNAPHNCEQVPGENMSIKMADKDKLLGYQNQYDIYSNQFIPLTTNADMLDRIKLQGLFDSHFSGGAICHLNCDTKIDNVDDIAELIRISAKMGVVYFAINYVLSECEDGHMTVSNDDVCAVCGKPVKDKYTRVVGFLTNIKNWHKTRREQDFPNRQFYSSIKVG